MIYIKLVFIACVVFISYNVWLNIHNNAAFEAVALKQDKAEIVEKMGKPFDIYRCGDKRPSFLIYADSLCKDTVEEVDAFAPCNIPPICPGWNSVAFDRAGQAVMKYRFAAP